MQRTDNRRGYLMQIVLCLSLLTMTAMGADQRPNILFIFSDDHSLQTLGAHKGRMQAFLKEHNVTPNLDTLAQEGVYFENRLF